jgi:GTP-binding protein
MTDTSDAELIEAGRKIFAGDWQFIWASPSIETLPPMKGVEVAFAGRSNVGKSSLINALTGRNGLARTSHTPGRTQELIFFDGPTPADGKDAGLRLVDMPGYGYASAPKSQIASWTALIHTFLQGRANLARVYVLIDARHGFKDVDNDVLKTLDRSAVSYQVVLTKADQVKKSELENTIAATRQALAKHPAAFPEVLVTSSRTGSGMPELRAAMIRLLRERSDDPKWCVAPRSRFGRPDGRRRRGVGRRLRASGRCLAACFRLVNAAVPRQRRDRGGAFNRARHRPTSSRPDRDLRLHRRRSTVRG